MPAYDYQDRFHRNLSIGQSPDRFVSYGKESTLELGTLHVKDPGRLLTNRPPINVQNKYVLDSPIQMFAIMQSCDSKASDYFGLFGKGDCAATKMAKKIPFDPYHVPVLHYRYFEPRSIILKEIPRLREAFSHYYNNTYYTSKIGIGTEEAIAVVITTRDKVNNTIRLQLKRMPLRLNENLVWQLRDNRPSKIKIIRFSSADHVFTSRVFRLRPDFVANLRMADAYLEEQKNATQRIVSQIGYSRVDKHIRYTFTMYQAPGLAHPIVSPEEPALWNSVTSISVRAHRIYLQHKNFRKDCRSKKPDEHKEVFCICPLVLDKMGDLRKMTTSINDHRRKWTSITAHEKERFISITSTTLYDLSIILNELTSYLKKQMRKANLLK